MAYRSFPALPGCMTHASQLSSLYPGDAGRSSGGGGDPTPRHFSCACYSVQDSQIGAILGPTSGPQDATTTIPGNMTASESHTISSLAFCVHHIIHHSKTMIFREALDLPHAIVQALTSQDLMHLQLSCLWASWASTPASRQPHGLSWCRQAPAARRLALAGTPSSRAPLRTRLAPAWQP